MCVQAKGAQKLCNSQITGTQARILQELRHTRAYPHVQRALQARGTHADPLLAEKCTASLLLFEMDVGAQGGAQSGPEAAQLAGDRVAPFRALLAVDKGSLLESELNLLRKQLHNLRVLDPAAAPASPSGCLDSTIDNFSCNRSST